MDNFLINLLCKLISKSRRNMMMHVFFLGFSSDLSALIDRRGGLRVCANERCGRMCVQSEGFAEMKVYHY